LRTEGEARDKKTNRTAGKANTWGDFMCPSTRDGTEYDKMVLDKVNSCNHWTMEGEVGHRLVGHSWASPPEDRKGILALRSPSKVSEIWLAAVAAEAIYAGDV
jgi:hypothetical protein